MTKKAVKKSAPVRSPLRVGNKVFIRTVTHHYTGMIVGLDKQEILLRDAAWIADDGRFHTAMATGALDEIEPYPDAVTVSINRGALLDANDWLHDLPRAVR